ncbi:MAG: recombination protein O N-terminal domain-containing protein [Candidatus Paceibacterota bacterium]
MAYQTYTTEAVVCGSYDRNTSDRSYLLFTHDAGMLYATARSVREERSKQRYALQDFSLIRVSLVRGKNGWRIGSVENEQNAFLHPSATRVTRTHLLRLVKLLRQFLHGEEAHPELYADVRQAIRALAHAENAKAERISGIMALRTLHKLGYIASHDSFARFLNEPEWTSIHDDLPPEAAKAVDAALTASHL